MSPTHKYLLLRYDSQRSGWCIAMIHREIEHVQGYRETFPVVGEHTSFQEAVTCGRAIAALEQLPFEDFTK